ncbi:helix-turn-helix domain-containing protein [Candidatus Berkelbacteria bacterium]|nr:helix-turn-helix domain-containing protein [Candidatus Berkelbacteria bacterium]
MASFTKKKISKTQSLGEKLTRARKRHKLSLRQVEQLTKVAFKHLQALEKGDYKALPTSFYTRGFLTRVAKLFNLKVDKVLADYETELNCYNSVKPECPKIAAGLIKPEVKDDWLRNPDRLKITPGFLWGGVLSFCLVAILGYIWFQVTSFAAAPPLDIVTPAQAIKVDVELVEVAGVTDPTASLKINNQPVVVDTEGHFRQQVKLSDGVNAIEISAMNKADKETTKVIQLLAELPEVDSQELIEKIQEEKAKSTVDVKTKETSSESVEADIVAE